jgi:BirA family biotin operon repressor/biotin-[acetyl-CoA-carboxylase] ligase
VTLHRHDLIDSTNDEALRLARDGASDGTVVVARQQSAGRGRQGRIWVSPPGNLYVSYLFRTSRFPGVATGRVAEIGFVAVLAVADTLDTIIAGCRLKWPNDVLLAGAKIAGILTEMTGDAIVIGIGINVAHSPPDMPYPVISAASLGGTASADDVLVTLTARLDQRLADWQAHGFGPVREAWLQRGPILGQMLTARVGASSISGGFAGLAEDGALLLTTPDGPRRIVAGEVLPS